jgi:hypothetical protein
MKTFNQYVFAIGVLCLATLVFIGCPEEIARRDNIKPHEHEWEWRVTKAATYREAGMDMGICACGVKETRPTALINSISELSTALASLPANTVSNPHTLVVNLISMNGIEGVSKAKLGRVHTK